MVLYLLLASVPYNTRRGVYMMYFIVKRKVEIDSILEENQISVPVNIAYTLVHANSILDLLTKCYRRQ